MLVMKFGGTSVESAEALRRVAGIIQDQLDRQPVVVVSAIGKTTNQLLGWIDSRSEQEWMALRDRHLALASELLGDAAGPVCSRIHGLFQELHNQLFEPASSAPLLQQRDAVAAFGERLSSELLTALLVARGVPAAHVDARALVVTDAQHGCAVVDQWLTYGRMRRSLARIAQSFVPVLGGFIGSTEEGVTTTLGRGGSDLTASLVGAALQADEIQIWTDVDGILTCDPRVHESGVALKSISYEEAFELARLGAKVLYPPAVQPAMRQRIPLVIRNSRRPEAEGTRVLARPISIPMVRGIACLGHEDRVTVALVGRGVRYEDEILERACSALGDLAWRPHHDKSGSVLAFSLPAALAGDAVRRLHFEFFERVLPRCTGRSLGISEDVAVGIPSDFALAS